MKRLFLLSVITLCTIIICINVEAQTVYITKTGAKYHKDGCRYLSKSKIAISLDDAIKRGYTPCSVCNPPLKSSVKNVNPTEPQLGYITTIVDGSDVGSVNLWHHKTERTIIVTKCTNNQKVTILEDDGTYVKLKTSDGKIGWCMKGFVVIR